MVTAVTSTIWHAATAVAPVQFPMAGREGGGWGWRGSPNNLFLSPNGKLDDGYFIPNLDIINLGVDDVPVPVFLRASRL